MIVAMAFALISAKFRYYDESIIILLFLVLALLAFFCGKVLHVGHPVIAAAVAELVGISLGAAAFIYPISVLFGGRSFVTFRRSLDLLLLGCMCAGFVLLGGLTLCYLPPIFGLVIAEMYVYRRASIT